MRQMSALLSASRFDRSIQELQQHVRAAMGSPEEEDVEATLENEANEAAERLDVYFRRGRRLRSLRDVDLTDGWVSMVNQWADGSADFSEQNLDDYESEMHLRGIDLPFDRIEERVAVAEARFETNLQKFRDIAKQPKR
jgi:hypothetical protein